MSNNNFGQSLIIKDNEIFIEKSAISTFDKRLDIFCRNLNKTAEEKLSFCLRLSMRSSPKQLYFSKIYQELWN